MSEAPLREIEYSFAAEAAAHARAALELNPFCEAESLELGDGRAVYTGTFSAVHGVSGIGLEGAVEERDLREIEHFYLRKERPATFWVTSFADPSLRELLARDYKPTRTLPVHGATLGQGPLGLPEPSGSSSPDPGDWALGFTRALDPAAREAGLLALTKLHQRETRYYRAQSSASYTFFFRGIALVPFPPVHSLLALQAREAEEFRCRWIVTAGASPLPFLYERTLYEPI
jgi:hypothetical protein